MRIDTISAEEVGRRIRAAREASRLSATDLAAKLGVEWRQIAAWEAGVETPPFAMLLHLAEALHAPVAKFLE